MNRPDDIDTILAGWFLESAPSTVPAEIHPGVIARARSSRQRVRWAAALGEVLDRPARRPAVQAASIGSVAVAILATVLVIGPFPAGVSPASSQSPTSTTSTASSASARPSASTASTAPSDGSEIVTSFVPAFTYAIPEGSGLIAIGGRHGAVAWVVGPNHEATDPSAPNAFGGQDPDAGNLHGLMVANVSHAWGHGLDGRVPLRADPAGFLADMDTLLAGFDLEPVTATTLDGRPALVTRTVPGTGSGYDLHLDVPITGLAGPGVFLAGPYQITVADIGGVTVFVQVWADSEDDLATWLPVAQRFVDSMHFVDR
ncbi:MAG: hypothetical protein ACJ77Y_06255 [Chloroflexota bacterium]